MVGSIVPVALSRSISRCLHHLSSLRHGKALSDPLDITIQERDPLFNIDFT